MTEQDTIVTRPEEMCPIKSKLFYLKEVSNASFSNIDSDSSDASPKRNLLKQANIISREILDIHDGSKNCECFNKACESVSPDQNKMSELLEYLSSVLVELSNISAIGSSSILNKSALNPHSECFIPKNFSRGISSEGLCIKDNGSHNKQNDSSMGLLEKLILKENDLMNLEDNSSATTADVTSNGTKPFLAPIGPPRTYLKSIWSTTPEDKMLLNCRRTKRCGSSPALSCPSTSDIGNILDIKSSHKEKGVHTGLDESSKVPITLGVGNSPNIDMNYFEDIETFLQSSSTTVSPESEKERVKRLERYKDMGKSYVEDICSLLKESESEQKSDPTTHCVKHSSVSPDEGISLSDEERSDKKMSTCELKFESESDAKLLLYDVYDPFESSDNCTFRCSSPCSVWCDSNKTHWQDKENLVPGKEKIAPVREVPQQDIITRLFSNLPRGSLVSNSCRVGHIEEQNVERKNLWSNLEGTIPSVNMTGEKVSVGSYSNADDIGVVYRSVNVEELYMLPVLEKLPNSDKFSKNFESENWTPLPDCPKSETADSFKHQQKTTKWNSGYDRPQKYGKVKPKRNFAYTYRHDRTYPIERSNQSSRKPEVC